MAADSIRIEATVIGDRSVVRVVDHGPGVAPHLTESIFSRFVTTGGPSTTPRGVGVGL